MFTHTLTPQVGVYERGVPGRPATPAPLPGDEVGATGGQADPARVGPVAATQDGFGVRARARPAGDQGLEPAPSDAPAAAPAAQHRAGSAPASQQGPPADAVAVLQPAAPAAGDSIPLLAPPRGSRRVAGRSLGEQSQA